MTPPDPIRDITEPEIPDVAFGRVLVADDPALVAAGIVADRGREAIAARGRFVLAVSGGSTPVPLFERLGAEDLDWSRTTVVQVDERVVAEDSDERNLETLRHWLSPGGMTVEAMPVDVDDLDGAAADYGRRLAELAGSPPVLDVVHLGLGADGHTASLVAGDPVLLVRDRDVAVTGPYQGRPRMTLTYPVLDRARTVVWFVTGEAKASVVRRLVDGDTAIPAGRVAATDQVLVADRAAGSELLSR